MCKIYMRKTINHSDEQNQRRTEKGGEIFHVHAYEASILSGCQFSTCNQWNPCNPNCRGAKFITQNMSLQHEDYYGQIVLSHESLRKFLFLPPYCQKNLDRRYISEKQLLPQIISYQLFVKTPFCILFSFGMSLKTHLANMLFSSSCELFSFPLKMS